MFSSFHISIALYTEIDGQEKNVFSEKNFVGAVGVRVQGAVKGESENGCRNTAPSVPPPEPEPGPRFTENGCQNPEH